MCKNVSKLLSVVLALALVVTMLAVPAHAEETAVAYVAEVGGVQYETLAAAIKAADAGETVTMLKSTEGSGVVINKSVNIEFGGYTYTFTEPAVGSSGTESNGFQILSGNTVGLYNGTLKVADAYADQYYVLIQNYADLTVCEMVLDGTNLDKWVTTYNDSYVLSNNCGTVNITGCTITANNDGELAYAFDACQYQSYDAPTVTATNCKVTGMVEVTGGILSVRDGSYQPTSQCTDAFIVSSGSLAIGGDVTVTGGVLDGSTAVWAKGTGNVTINGGIYTITEPVGADVEQGYNDVIYARDSAIVTVNGGYFTGPARTTDGQRFLLNLNDNCDAKFVVTGGTFEDFNPAKTGTEPEGKNDNFLVDGYCVGIDNTTYTVDEHKLTAVEAKPATCSKDGVRAHYTCENCGKLYNDPAGLSPLTQQQATIPATGKHTLALMGGTKATCRNSAYDEHYECVDCKACFADAEGKTPANKKDFYKPMLDHDRTFVKGTVTCTESGSPDHYACSMCEGWWSDAEGKNSIGFDNRYIDALGHDLTKVAAVEPTCAKTGMPAYEYCNVCEKGFFSAITGNGEIVEVEFDPTNVPEEIIIPANGHDLTKVPAKEVTCTVDGNIEHYVCSVCDRLYVDAEGKMGVSTPVVKAVGHQLTKVDAVAPTYTAGGNIEHYACSACDGLFADAEGKTATTAEAVKLAQLIEIKESTAEVSSDAVDTAIKEAETTGSVTIDLVEVAESETTTPDSGSDSEADTETKPAPVVSSAALPVESLEKVSEISEEATLTINMTEVTVTMDSKTMAAVAEQSAGETVTLKVEKVETKTLTEKQQAAVEDKEVAVVITATMISNNTAISDFKGGNVTIAVPFTPVEGTVGSDYQVYYVDDEGNMTAHDTEYKNGCLVFSTSHFSDYVVVNTADPTVPKTGDSANLLLHTSVMVIALAGLTALFIGKKKFSF